MRPSRPARGLTLIEMLAVLAIMGFMALVAVPSLETALGVRAREEAGRISGALRYLYGASALYGRVCRMVFDLDAGAYWAECTQDKFTVATERSSGGKRADDEEPEERRGRNTGFDDERVRQQVEKRANFSAFGDQEIPRRKLPSGAELSVWSTHQTEAYKSGKAYLYFFPQGHTEKARIWVRSGHGDTYTLSVSPLNGRVLVVNEDLEVPRG